MEKEEFGENFFIEKCQSAAGVLFPRGKDG